MLMDPFSKLFPNQSFVKVLSLFLSRPDEQFYQADVVVFSKCALIQAQRALMRLVETGLVNKKKSGARFYYIANQKHPVFEDIKSAFYKTILFGEQLKAALIKANQDIHYGFIYGSLASGKESVRSDIDLFIVGDLGIRDVAEVLSEVSSELGREINPTVYSLDEFILQLKKKNSFILEVIRSPKIWLIGDEGEFKRMDC